MSRFGDPDHPDPKEAGKDTQFQPGESGNPTGKPPGTRSLAWHIQNLLNDEEFEFIILNGKEKGNKLSYKGTPMKAIIGVAIHKAIKGDPKWAEWLAKHGYGNKIVLGAEDPVEAALRKLGLWEGEEDAGQNSGTSETTP